MLKFVDVCFVNDSCSSSKTNMDLCAATLKTEVDDTGLGLHKGVWNHVSPEVLGINSNCSCWRSCKVCDLSKITMKMLIYDHCEESFHVSCYYPRLKKRPHDEWFCHSCLKKRRKILKESTRSSEMSSCRNATSKGVLGPIAVMLEDSEPYTINVRIGGEFQVDIPAWSGPIATMLMSRMSMMKIQAIVTRMETRDYICMLIF